MTAPSTLVFVLFFALCVATLNAESLFDFSLENLDGELVSLSDFDKAKAILVVNVATNCGYTYANYKELSDMYSRLHDKGLEILAFPCNQFGGQEPGSSEDIKKFAARSSVTFPVFQKIEVNGPKAHPIYKYLKKATDNTEVPWNFSKFLLKGDGKPIQRYRPNVSPRTIENDIMQLLDDSSAHEL